MSRQNFGHLIKIYSILEDETLQDLSHEFHAEVQLGLSGEIPEDGLGARYPVDSVRVRHNIRRSHLEEFRSNDV